MYETRAQRIALAQQRIDRVNRKFEFTAESVGSSGYVRHKCFVSYHSDDTEEAADFVESLEPVFIPRAIGVSEEDDIIESTDVDYIRDTIRTNYLRDSTVTIVLVGRCTWARKFVDWEIYSSLRDGKIARHNGLLGILLPSASSPFPPVPDRLSANIPRDGDDAYGRYRSYPPGQSSLRGWIQDAFDARTAREELIKNGDPLFQRNRSCS